MRLQCSALICIMSNIISGIDLPIMCQVQMFLQYQEVPAMTDVGVFRQLPFSPSALEAYFSTEGFEGGTGWGGALVLTAELHICAETHVSPKDLSHPYPRP